MLSGATPSASAIAGTAVLRMVVSSDSMKNATATSHGSSLRLASEGSDDGATSLAVLGVLIEVIRCALQVYARPNNPPLTPRLLRCAQGRWRLPALLRSS